MRFLGLTAVVAIVGIAGVGAASTLRRDNGPVTETSAGNVVPTGEKKVVSSRGAPVAVELQAAPAQTPAAPSPPPVAAPTVAPEPTLSVRGSKAVFVLIEGRTTLTDSVYAVRTGDSVVVNFDTQGSRTRRADKFERIVRSTLPMVYGKLATLPIDSIPEGSLLPSRDVVGALEASGMQLTLENGTKILVRPLTRVGRDGALAIAYLTVVQR